MINLLHPLLDPHTIINKVEEPNLNRWNLEMGIGVILWNEMKYDKNFLSNQHFDYFHYCLWGTRCRDGNVVKRQLRIYQYRVNIRPEFWIRYTFSHIKQVKTENQHNWMWIQVPVNTNDQSHDRPPLRSNIAHGFLLSRKLKHIISFSLFPFS